jgi:hypothetical protein
MFGTSRGTKACSLRGLVKENDMTPRTRLVLASILFAVLWTAGMIWWTGTDIGNVVGLWIGGAVAGVLWYFAMDWWMRWWENHRAG